MAIKGNLFEYNTTRVFCLLRAFLHKVSVLWSVSLVFHPDLPSPPPPAPHLTQVVTIYCMDIFTKYYHKRPFNQTNPKRKDSSCLCTPPFLFVLSLPVGLSSKLVCIQRDPCSSFFFFFSSPLAID